MISQWLYRLDQLRPAQALLGGGVVGLLLAAFGVVGLGGWLGAVFCVGVLALVGVVAWRTEPRWVVEGGEVVEPDTSGLDSTPGEVMLPVAPVPELPRVVEDLGGLLAMVELPGGTFLMGSPEGDNLAVDREYPQHPVTVSPFAIGQTTVTRGIYRQIMKRSPSAWSEGEEDNALPATHVNWFDAIAFCNALSATADLTPCYEIDGKRVSWNRQADGYRLPTEAEWEYACRAGTTIRWFFGDEYGALGDYAWFDEDIDSSAHPVAQKRPNPWGLYDMAGNVWEWCWDWFGDYAEDAQTDPDGPPTGEHRVLRGGSFLRRPRRLRSAFRDGGVPEFRRWDRGLRIVRSSRRQP